MFWDVRCAEYFAKEVIHLEDQLLPLDEHSIKSVLIALNLDELSTHHLGKSDKHYATSNFNVEFLKDDPNPGPNQDFFQIKAKVLKTHK